MRRNCQRQTVRSCTADSFSIHSRSMTRLKRSDQPVNSDKDGDSGNNCQRPCRDREGLRNPLQSSLRDLPAKSTIWNDAHEHVVPIGELRIVKGFIVNLLRNNH